MRDCLWAIVLIGLDAEPMASALAKHAADVPVNSIGPGETVMSGAVAAARALATLGDTGLLSPLARPWINSATTRTEARPLPRR